jgi:hypothetical protein
MEGTSAARMPLKKLRIAMKAPDLRNVQAGGFSFGELNEEYASQ